MTSRHFVGRMILLVTLLWAVSRLLPGQGDSILRRDRTLARAAPFLPAPVVAQDAGQAGTSPHAVHSKRASSAIAITPDGGTLLVVNPDSNSTSLVDTGTGQVVEISTGVDPRTVVIDDSRGRAYVASRGSDSISVVDLATGSVIADISTGDRPYGVVLGPGGDPLYIAEQGADRVRVVDTTTHATLALLPVPDRPSGLAVTGEGKVYVSHLLTDTISILDQGLFAVYLPLVIKSTEKGAGAPLTFASPQLPARQPAPKLVGSIRLWPDSNLVQSIVLSPEGTRAYVAHTRSNTGNRVLTFDTTVFPIVSLIDTDSDSHLVGEQLTLDTIDPPGVGLPFDVALSPDGGEIWVLNAASNDLTVVNTATGQRVAHIEVGDNPRGIVMAPGGGQAYVNNTLAGTVSVVDTAAYTVTDVLTVTTIPLPPVLLQGKRLFHSSDDARLAQDQWIACNTCHFEGEHDGRTWTFGFAGPRNTTSLLGMIETYPLRWSGEWDESADSEFANRRENFGSGLIEGDMNCSLSPADCANQPPNQGRSADLDALAAFVDSLRIPWSPGHDQSQPLAAAEKRGQALFLDPSLGCVDCHPPPLYTDQKLHDVGTTTPDERLGPAYDTPTLRGLYDSAPYFHDGSAALLYDTLTRPSEGGEHDLTGLLDEAGIQDLIAFLGILPFSE